MFKNIEELQNEILEGKTNEQIIQERIAYLTSDEYKNSRLQPIFNQQLNQLMFYDGYVQPQEKIPFSHKGNGKCYYGLDVITELYSVLIDYVRKNMVKKENPINDLLDNVKMNGEFVQDSLMMQVWKYFQEDKKQKYYKITELFKKIGGDKKTRYAREKVPHVIHLYEQAEGFDGTLDDFVTGYLLFEHISHNPKLEQIMDNPNEIELYQKFKKVISPEDFVSAYTIPLSKIKGLGIGACTEKSLLIQNCMAFLGFETYVLGGNITHDGVGEGHNFNVVKRNSDTFSLIDVAQFLTIPEIPEVHSIKDVRNTIAIRGKRATRDATEVTYSVADEIRTKSMLQQKEEELSSLETEAKKISKAEALIEQQKEGQDMGES